MPSPAWEDLDQFFDLADFADEMTFYTTHGERKVPGIFDDPYLNPRTGELNLETSEVMFACKESDAPKSLVDRGVKACLGYEQYEVLRNKPDGTGVTTVTLRPMQ